VGGAVDRPLSLSFDALTRLPTVERYQTLECISNEVGGQYISTGLFSGVPVREILTRAGVRDGAVQVVFATASGFSDSIGLDAAMDPSTLVVVGLNRHRLPVEHGFPARLLAVGSYGMKNPKWLTDIQVVKQPYQGFWERRGWSNEAIVRTNARIDVPSPGARAAEVRTVAGIAFAGNRGISKVEVSLDGGSTWHPATLKSALSPFTWRLWRFDPEPGSLEGARSVTVRAYDGTGAVQSGRREDPFPKGSSGYHSVSLRP
jgi:DMSO/TMAO reductase YedYZ molybdopterin-dependent catalytic subunit